MYSRTRDAFNSATLSLVLLLIACLKPIPHERHGAFRKARRMAIVYRVLEDGVRHGHVTFVFKLISSVD